MTNRFTETALRRLGRSLLALGTLALLPLLSWGQTTIAQQDFETTPATPTAGVSISGGAYYTGSSASGDSPASSPFFSQGARAYGVSNGTTTISSSANINASAYSNVAVQFRLASFSVNSSGNGADAADLATLAISVDGGTTYVNQVRVAGNANARWSYAGGTATATRAYASTAVTVFAPAAGGLRTTDGYSTVSVTGIPASAQLRFRITLTNDDTNERWLVDDVQITGTVATNAAPTVTTTTPATGVTAVAATVAGNITNLGFPTASTSYGFVYSTTASTAATLQLGGGGVSQAEVGTTGATTGSYSTTLSGLTPSTTYYYRAYATNSTGTGYGDVQSFTTTAPSITDVTVSAGAPVCATTASDIRVSFTTSGTFSGTYAVQLSDASGSFASPATLATTGTGSPLTATIPANTASGTGYLVRVVNTNPLTFSSSSGAFTIVSNPTVSIAPTATQTIAAGAAGTALTATESPATGTTRVWQVASAAAGPFSNISPAQTGTSYTPTFASAGTYFVRVLSTFAACGSVASNVVEIDVTNPVPAISSLAPPSAAVGSGSFTLTVNGSNFVSGAVVNFNGAALTTTFVSASQLTAAVPASATATVGSYPVTVTNPAPGSTTSAAATFYVTNNLVYYAFTTSSAAPTTVAANFAATSVTRNVVTQASTTADQFISSNYADATFTSTKYVAFTVNPAAGYTATLQTISVDVTRSGTGPPSLELRSSLDNYGSAIGGVQTITATDVTAPNSLLFVLDGTFANLASTAPVTFRIYGYGNSNTGGTQRLDNLTVTGTLTALPTGAFYSKPTGDLNVLATFGANPDGSGTAPGSFATPGSIYNVTGTGRTITANWVVSGSNSKVVLTAGASFIVPVGFTYTGSLDQQANSTLTIVNTSAAAYGNITQTSVQDATSTIEFAQASGSFSVPTTSSFKYQNLKLTNATKLFGAGSTTVPGDLTLQDVANAAGTSNASVGSLVTVGGNVTLLGTTTFNPASATRIDLSLSGSGTQTLSGNGNTLRVRRLRTLTSGIGAVLADANGGTPLEAGTAGLADNGGVELVTGTTLALNGNTLTFTAGGGAQLNTYTSSYGTITVTPASSLNLENAGSGIGFLELTNGASTLNNLRIVNGSGDYLEFYSLPSPTPSAPATTLTVNGTLTLGSATSRLYIGDNHTLVLNGTLAGSGTLIGGTGSSLTVGGSGALNPLTFDAGYATLQNLTLNRTGGPVTLGSALTVSNALTLTSGGLDFGGRTLTLNGTVTGPGLLYGSTSSSLVVGGTGALGTLTFAPGSQVVRNLTLNRTGSGTAALGSPLTVGAPTGGTLTLTSGQLLTTAANVPTLPRRTSLAGGSDASFVNGPLRRLVRSVSAATPIVFPIGKGTAYRPVTLNVATQADSTIYQAELLNQDGGTNVTAPVQRVNRNRYVTVTPYSGTTPATVQQPAGFSGTITLSFGYDDKVNNPAAASLQVAKRSDSSQPWVSTGASTGNTSTGTSTGPAGTFASGTLTSASFTSFSDFTLASTDPDAAVNPLPVELTAFTARRAPEGSVALAWTTASEKNSAYFDVERSPDGQHFAPLARVQAAGSSPQARRYAARDEAAPAAGLYYRLRMVDLDGSFAYSPVVSVAAGQAAGGAGELTLAPNPAREQLRVLTEQASAYVVRNALGQVVLTGTTAAGTATPLDVAGLAGGVYVFELHGQTGRVVRRFVKE